MLTGNNATGGRGSNARIEGHAQQSDPPRVDVDEKMSEMKRGKEKTEEVGARFLGKANAMEAGCEKHAK
jgi:hypothetical protein